MTIGEVWTMPPAIKIYEALGSVVDGRVEVIVSDELFAGPIQQAKVWSSSGNKYYDIFWDESNQAIMANDNATWFKDYLGYPAVSYLLAIGKLEYDPNTAEYLKDIKWKDINQETKNNYHATLVKVKSIVEERGGEWKIVVHECNQIFMMLKELNLKKLGPKIQPPKGY